MAKFKGSFEFRRIPGQTKSERTFAVTAVSADGQRARVGQVIERKIRHMNMMIGWIAESPKGHRAAHVDREHAAAALLWDGQSYDTLIHPL